MSFFASEIAANAGFAGKIDNASNLAEQQERLIQQMLKDNATYRAAGMHYPYNVIDPGKCVIS